MKGKAKIEWPGGNRGREYWIASLFVEGVLKGTPLDPNTWKAGVAVPKDAVTSYFASDTVFNYHLTKTRSIIRDGAGNVKVNDIEWFKTTGKKVSTATIRDWKATIVSGKHKPGSPTNAYKLEKI